MGANESTPSAGAGGSSNQQQQQNHSSSGSGSVPSTSSANATSGKGPAAPPRSPNPVTVAMEEQQRKRAEAAARNKEAKDIIREQREMEKMEREMAKAKIKERRDEEKRVKAEERAVKEAEREAKAADRERRRAANAALEAQQRAELEAAMDGHDDDMARAMEEARRMVAQTRQMAAPADGEDYEEEGGPSHHTTAALTAAALAQQQQQHKPSKKKKEKKEGDGDDDDDSSVEVSTVNSADYRDEDLMHDFNTLVMGPRADELSEQIPILKKDAVAKMKAGDKAGALEALKTAKAMEKELAYCLCDARRWGRGGGGRGGGRGGGVRHVPSWVSSPSPLLNSGSACCGRAPFLSTSLSRERHSSTRQGAIRIASPLSSFVPFHGFFLYACDFCDVLKSER